MKMVKMSGDMGLLGLILAEIEYVTEPDDEILAIVKKLRDILDAEKKDRFGMDTITAEMKYCIDKINKWYVENKDFINEKTKNADPKVVFKEMYEYLKESPARRVYRYLRNFYYDIMIAFSTLINKIRDRLRDFQ